MQYDVRIQPTVEFLTRADRGIIIPELSTDADVVKILPDGWKRMVNPLLLLTQTFPTIRLTHMRLDRGLLRVYAVTDDAKLADLFERVTQSVARESSAFCMVCGERGNRKKTEQYSPSLCREHYIQYINWIDQNVQQS